MNLKYTTFAVSLAFVVNATEIKAANYNSKFPLEHPEFCYSQTIRVNDVASFLNKWIHDRSVGNTENGYLSARYVWRLRQQIVMIEDKVTSRMLFLSGHECGRLGNRGVKAIGDIWRKLVETN